MGEILESSRVPTLTLQAGLVIGSGSASFEMVRHLTDVLPVMPSPRWVLNRVQPIAVRDVLHYLSRAAEVEWEESRRSQHRRAAPSPRGRAHGLSIGRRLGTGEDLSGSRGDDLGRVASFGCTVRTASL